MPNETKPAVPAPLVGVVRPLIVDKLRSMEHAVRLDFPGAASVYGQAADEIERLRSALKQCADAIEWNEGKRPHNLTTIGRAYWRARRLSAA